MKLRDNFLFSKSSILMYKNCPMSFYFRYMTDYGRIFRKIAEEPEHLTIGTNLHQFYEEFNKGNDIADVEEILCEKDIYAHNIMGFYEILNEYKMKRALEAESKYLNEDEHFVGYVDAVYELSDETIDIIMEKVNKDRKRLIKKPDGNLAVIDYKTGKYRENFKRKYEYELNFYVHLIESMSDKKIDYIGMMFTKSSDCFIQPVNRKNVEKDIADVFTQIDNINNNQFPRNHTKLCSYCDYKAICDEYQDDVIQEATETYY